MKKVIVIEDQTILRDLICRLLESFPTFELTAATGDGQEGYKLCIKHQPDFVILDVMLPNLNGLEILQRLKSENPRTQVLVFSAISNTGMVKKIIESKVDGFLEKDAGLAEMEKAINGVASGQSYFGPKIVEIMRTLMMNPDQGDSLEILTTREREIIQLIAESNSTKEIAEKLCISARTADTHRSNIMRKLGIHDIAGLTRFAISCGLVEPDKSL